MPGPASINWTEYYETLNLSPDEEYSINSLNKAYRKAALRSHPDKGGNVDLVFVLFDPFFLLLMLSSSRRCNRPSRCYKANSKRRSRTNSSPLSPSPSESSSLLLQWGLEWLLLKTPPREASLPRSQSLSPTPLTAVPQEVYDSLVVDCIDPEAGERPQRGDLIVKIESDEIRNWSLARCMSWLLSCPD
jgi:hypothetical protein